MRIIREMICMTAVGVLSIFIVGCRKEQTVQKTPLDTFLRDQNRIALEKDPRLKGVSLHIKKTDRSTFVIALQNNSKRTYKIFRPIKGYTISLHFYDNSAKEIHPKTILAGCLPAIDESQMVSFGPGTEYVTSVDRSTVLEEISGLELASFVAASYLPSDFVVDEKERTKVDLATARIWSNAESW